MASYWIALFSAQYGENRDAIFISMKTFNGEPDDQYPTFSLCFKGDRFHWNRDDNIFDSYALNATQYELMLKGEVAMMDELNKSSGLYEKKPVFLQNGVDVNIKDDVNETALHYAPFEDEIPENLFQDMLKRNIEDRFLNTCSLGAS